MRKQSAISFKEAWESSTALPDIVWVIFLSGQCIIKKKDIRKQVTVLWHISWVLKHSERNSNTWG